MGRRPMCSLLFSTLAYFESSTSIITPIISGFKSAALGISPPHLVRLFASRKANGSKAHIASQCHGIYTETRVTGHQEIEQAKHRITLNSTSPTPHPLILSTLIHSLPQPTQPHLHLPHPLISSNLITSSHTTLSSPYPLIQSAVSSPYPLLEPIDVSDAPEAQRHAEGKHRRQNHHAGGGNVLSRQKQLRAQVQKSQSAHCEGKGRGMRCKGLGGVGCGGGWSSFNVSV